MDDYEVIYTREFCEMWWSYAIRGLSIACLSCSGRASEAFLGRMC